MVLLVLLSPKNLSELAASDGDVFMHWRFGETMLQTREIIRKDIFSHTCYGRPVVPKEWLSQVLLALAGRLGGLTGLGVLAAVVIATTLALMHRQLVRDGADPLLSAGLVLVAVWAAQVHWHARPHVFSILLLFFWNDVLRRFERTSNGWGCILALAGLTVLWVNLHGAYLAGFLTLGMYWTGAAIECLARRKTQDAKPAQRLLYWLSMALLACAGVSLLNPSGYLLHVHNVQFLRSEFFVSILDEYRSMDFHTAGGRGFAVWLAITLTAALWRRSALTPTAVVLLFGWSYLALYSVRNIPLMTIVVAPILAPMLSEGVRSFASDRWRDFLDRVRRIHEEARGRFAALAIALIVPAFIPVRAEVPEKKWPVAAVRFIQQHPQQFEGNMLNHYNLGSFLLWFLPEHKVFIDGRADSYGEVFVREYVDADMLSTNWVAIMEKYKVDWTLFGSEHALNRLLETNPGWRNVYSDGQVAIFTRDQ